MTYEQIFEAAVKEGQVRDMIPVFKSWDTEGDILIGRFISYTQIQSSENDGTYLQYLLDTDIGYVKFSLGVMADRDLASTLEVGKIYAFRFLGKEKLKGGRTVNKFQVRMVTDQRGDG